MRDSEGVRGRPQIGRVRRSVGAAGVAAGRFWFPRDPGGDPVNTFRTVTELRVHDLKYTECVSHTEHCAPRYSRLASGPIGLYQPCDDRSVGSLEQLINESDERGADNVDS